MNQLIESKKIDFSNLTSDNENKKSKLNDNLKNHFPHLSADVFLNPNSLIIDCGANIGDISSIFNRYGATVYAFEPTEITFNLLEKRFNKQNNINCIKKAVWIENTNLKFYHHEWSSFNKIHWSNGNSLLKEKKNVSENDFEIVNAIDLSEFILSFNKNIDLVKMDIEGSEIQFINHLIDTGAINKVNMLICEVHDRKYEFLRESTNKLKKRVFDLNLHNKIYLDCH